MKPKLNLEHLKHIHPKNVRKALIIAIIYKGKKVISYGFNRKVMTSHKNAFGKYTEVFTIHGEDAALRKAGPRAKGADIMIIRLKKNGGFGLAKPCYTCQYLIDKAGINRRDWTK